MKEEPETQTTLIFCVIQETEQRQNEDKQNRSYNTEKRKTQDTERRQTKQELQHRKLKQ